MIRVQERQSLQEEASQVLERSLSFKNWEA